MSVDTQEAQRVLAEADLLYSAEQVSAAYDRLAGAITATLGDTQPVVLSVLTGGLVATGQLLPRLNFLLEVNYVHATRYQGGTRGSDLSWITRPSIALVNRTVLIVDDILDEGITLAAIHDYCREQGVMRIYTAVLVEKQIPNRAIPVQVEFTGLHVDNRYVFGCGMDYHGFHRNLPAIYAVNDNV